MLRVMVRFIVISQQTFLKIHTLSGVPTAAELQTPLGESRAFTAPRVEQPVQTLEQFYSDVESSEESESSSSDSG